MTPPIWLRALGAQLIALSTALGIFKAAGGLVPADSAWPFLLLHSLLAAGLSPLLRLRCWWIPIQAAFLPALILLLRVQLPPALYLSAFLLLWLFYRSNARERVPLYLSNRSARDALEELLEGRRSPSFLDLGAGLGGTLRHLALRRPDGRFHGVESAPLPFLIGRLRLWGIANARVRLGDLWREPLDTYDMVYAFLSPEPMPALWAHARAEMRPGALLVSNSFEIPGVTPTRVIHLDDRRRTRLWIYEMGGGETPREIRTGKGAPR